MSNLTYTVKAVDSNFELTATYEGKSLKDTLTEISNILKGMYNNRGMAAIEFDELELDGGDLYLKDSDGELYEADEAEYDVADFTDIIYYPNGSGEKSYIDYVAYTGNNEYVTGVITLKSSEFVLLTAEIDSDEVLDFDGEELLDAIYDWDDDFEVKYIKFTTVPNSTTSGYLYYEYDEDASSNTKVNTSTSYYVDATGSQKELTDYTSVPAASTDGVINIVFKAYKSTNSSITGIIQVKVTEVADITINAGKE